MWSEFDNRKVREALSLWPFRNHEIETMMGYLRSHDAERVCESIRSIYRHQDNHFKPTLNAIIASIADDRPDDIKAGVEEAKRIAAQMRAQFRWPNGSVWTFVPGGVKCVDHPWKPDLIGKVVLFSTQPDDPNGLAYMEPWQVERALQLAADQCKPENDEDDTPITFPEFVSWMQRDGASERDKQTLAKLKKLMAGKELKSISSFGDVVKELKPQIEDVNQ